MHLTELAQHLLEKYLNPGDLAIDATAGNGHDTCFLAQQVGATGKVYAFDIQQQALNSTASALAAQGFSEWAHLIHRGHEHLLEELTPNSYGKIKAVMFNLGYLPHADKNIVTTTATTLQALDQASRLLSTDGALSVLAYRGHPGGAEEAIAVEQKMQSLAGAKKHLSIFESSGPVLFFLATEAHD
ncbi:class I SAM-dependent methyltransferase [Thiolapillus sp.]